MRDRACFHIALVGFCLLLLSACGGGGGGSGSGGGAIAQIEITPQQENLAVGESRPLSAVAKTSSGNTVDKVSFAWQSLDPTIATIDANGVVTGRSIGVTTIIAATGTFRGSATVGVVSSSTGNANLNLSGAIFYEDKPYTASGFTGATQPKPVRGAIIKVISVDGFATIASGATGNDGTFSFSNLDNSTRRAGIYLQVISKTAPSNPSQIELRNNTADQALLSLISPPYDDSNGPDFTGLSVTATAASGIGGAFNILDVFSTASELVQQEGGPCISPATTSCTPPLLVAYWEPGGTEGTYFDDQLDAIFILGGGDSQGDTDEYDDPVIAHEYGHFAVHHFSKDDSLGGEHFITDHDQDVRLAFSEGWGNFFSSAVRKDPLYVDTATKGPTFSFNIENYSSLQATGLNNAAVYTTSEIAITGVFWDIFDDTSIVGTITESHDTLALGFAPIWQTLLHFSNTTPATMESFWLQFATLQPSSDSDGLKDIMRERKMKFFAPEDDPDEANEAATPNLNQGPQSHTLYQMASDPTGDEDVIPFIVTAGTKYLLETYNLTNGADTLLTVTDANGTPRAGLQNDNRNNHNYHDCGANPITGQNTCPRNDQTTLSSAITWTAGGSEPLYAHVQRSPNAPPSAGRFGSYDIRLTILP